MGVITLSVVTMVSGIMFAIRASRRSLPAGTDEIAALRARVAQLEQSIDVVAIEIERVGEAQRFTEQRLMPAAHASTRE